MKLHPAIRLFADLTSLPTAPFYEQGVLKMAQAWISRSLKGKVRVEKYRGGWAVRYEGMGPGPALAFAAHTDHPAFHLSQADKNGARARLQGGLRKELLPGAAVQAFSAKPSSNEPEALGVLGEPDGDDYPVRWTLAPKNPKRLAFAILALTPFEIRGPWLSSRSIDDVLGCAISLEALRQIAVSRVKTNVTVLLHRAEEVGFIGALDMIKSGAVSADDSILSIETSRELPDAVPGKGPVIRTGDKATLFDPNLLTLLDDAAKSLKVQRTRLTGGTCEATAYLSYGYESAGVAVPLINYHNGGDGQVEAEKVHLSDVAGSVAFLVEAAKRFAAASLRGRLRARLDARHKTMAPLLKIS